MMHEEGLRRSAWATVFRPAVLDRVEQVVVVVLFTLLVGRVLSSHNPFAPVLMISEAAIAVFVLIRRPTTVISESPWDWLLAILGTGASLLIVPGAPGPQLLVIPGVLLVLFGQSFQLWAKVMMNRSFGVAPANRGVKAGGPYRVVRHPMYAGYFTANIGLLMLMPSFFNFAVYLGCWSIQLYRLLAEERLLSEDPAYQALKARVRYRPIPGLY